MVQPPMKQFGSHTPVSESQKGSSSALETFRRGLVITPGTQWHFKFANGYGASVINDGYGAQDGLYELAVLNADGHLDYDTPITSDVLGYLTEDEVSAALDQIEALQAEVQA